MYLKFNFVIQTSNNIYRLLQVKHQYILKQCTALHCVHQLYHSHALKKKKLKVKASIFVSYLTYGTILYTRRKTMQASYFIKNL